MMLINNNLEKNYINLKKKNIFILVFQNLDE